MPPDFGIVRSLTRHLKQFWYACVHRLCVRIFFERVTLLQREHLPASGPTLYLGLHRNGAVDGFVYQQVLPRAIFLISTQLRRGLFARLFFHGITVARKTDEEDRRHNDEALRECLQLLNGGGELFIFPEGTSSLGACHLPFKSGAARLALDALERGIPLHIVPLGIHYERAWAFRSNVEVVIGEPIDTVFPPDSSPLGRLKEMKRRIVTALESVGANFSSSEAQEHAQRIASAATLGTTRSYFSALKSLEAGAPESLLAQCQELTSQLTPRRLRLDDDLPACPMESWPLALLQLLTPGPIVLAGALINLPPLFLGWLAAHVLADDRNVIALWRILVGVPVFVIWFVAINLGLAFLAGGGWVLAYILLTGAALKLFGHTRRLAVAVWDRLAHRDLASRVRQFHQSVQQTFAHP